MYIELIADIGINFSGDMDRAKLMIEQVIPYAIVKFQLYSVGKLFPNKQIIAQGKNWYNDVKGTELGRNEVRMLAGYTYEHRGQFMASAFDIERLSWLEELDVPVPYHKVAYNQHKNTELISAMIKTGKPVIVSCGHPDDVPIGLPSNSHLLYCIPMYPTPLSEIHFDRVSFGLPLGDDLIPCFDGFSDHSAWFGTSMIAVARGARIIERHFTLNPKDISGPDHICSMTRADLITLRHFCDKFEETVQ